MMDEWLSASLSSSTPEPSPSASTRMGIIVELVANPIPIVTAASLPRNCATALSSSRWTSRVPHSARGAPVDVPCSATAARTAGVHTSSQPPKPR